MRPKLEPMKHKKHRNKILENKKAAWWVRRSCEGKKTYYTHKAAARAANVFDKHFTKKSRVYHCPICGRYHISTQK